MTGNLNPGQKPEAISRMTEAVFINPVGGLWQADQYPWKRDSDGKIRLKPPSSEVK